MSQIGLTAAGASNLGSANVNVSTYTLIIPPPTGTGMTVFQVSTCTSTNNAIVLPTVNGAEALEGYTCTIRNDGAYALGVCPGGAGSVINALPILNPAAAQLSCFYVGANASCDFYCLTAVDGANQWYTLNYSGAKPVFFTTTATNLTIPTGLTQAVFSVAGASATANNYSITLPPPYSSIASNYRFFLNSANGAGSGGVVSIGGTGIDCVYGGGIGAVTTPIACQGVSFYNFAAAGIAGDWQDWTCDGTKWYVKAMGHVTVAFSTTA